MTDLILAVKKEYFDQIKAGTKLEEYRLENTYWSKRLDGRKYNRIVITLGYPKAEDKERRLVFPYMGYNIKTILHPHFGETPVKVFALPLTHQIKD